jgi:hypothetical protein
MQRFVSTQAKRWTTVSQWVFRPLLGKESEGLSMIRHCTFVLVFISALTAAASVSAQPDAEQAKALAKLAKTRLEAARKTYQIFWQNYREGQRSSDDLLYRWSLRWLEAERRLSDQQADQVAALKGHYERMVDLERIVRKVHQAGQGTVNELSAAEFYRTEAELWLLEAKTGKKAP